MIAPARGGHGRVRSQRWCRIRRHHGYRTWESTTPQGRAVRVCPRCCTWPGQRRRRNERAYRRGYGVGRTLAAVVAVVLVLAPLLGVAVVLLP